MQPWMQPWMFHVLAWGIAALGLAAILSMSL
ncbi:hypothetical protein ABIA03_006765 [Bradyrhizobium yuanmingense]|uniref:DUF2474 domain-containing protein n=1 Tax=Bradyrhizobium yuanmingense TaxID=108015 RepID=A0ABV4GUJ7_9BRAD